MRRKQREAYDRPCSVVLGGWGVWEGVGWWVGTVQQLVRGSRSLWTHSVELGAGKLHVSTKYEVYVVVRIKCALTASFTHFDNQNYDHKYLKLSSLNPIKKSAIRLIF